MSQRGASDCGGSAHLAPRPWPLPAKERGEREQAPRSLSPQREQKGRPKQSVALERNSALREEVRYSVCCASSEFCGACRAAKDRRRSRLARRPCAFDPSHVTLSLAGATGLIGFGRLLFPERSPSDASPVLRVTVSAASLRLHVRFGVIRPRPPCLTESIGYRRALRAGPVCFRTTGPTELASSCRHRVSGIDGSPQSAASLEVFVPCNARWPRSRCPGRPASGRSRFGVSSPSPARALG